jgi:hypothetical protein
MTLLDIPLVSDVFLQRLRADLDAAEVIRFAVAYISTDGLDAIGQDRLSKALTHPNSFGVSSLTCANGFSPLCDLQERIGGVRVPRLKYFMEPMVPDPETNSRIRLLHTKLIYLTQPALGKAVIYIGSHNWSMRALGPQVPRNAEASIRLEQPLVPGDLEGVGTSLGASVDQHLLNCFQLPLCLPVDASSLGIFNEWEENCCGRPRGEPLEQRAVVLAVHTGNQPTRQGEAVPWTTLEGKSVYAQLFDEEDGSQVPDRGQQLFVLVWDSRSALVAGEQPTLLICHVSTSNAGPMSSIAGTNRAENPISGFSAVLLDQRQLQAAIENKVDKQSPILLRSGLQVEAFDFDFPAPSRDARVIDGGAKPNYQFHLEVDRVVLPEERAKDASRGTASHPWVWSPESLTVADKEKGSIVKSPGFLVDGQTEEAMLQCLREVFQVNPDLARVRPYSQAKDPRVGLRISDHPLHDLLIGLNRETPDQFYDKVKGRVGRIVPARKDEGNVDAREGTRLLRVTRVFARKLDQLLQEWRR